MFKIKNSLLTSSLMAVTLQLGFCDNLYAAQTLGNQLPKYSGSFVSTDNPPTFLTLPKGQNELFFLSKMLGRGITYTFLSQVNLDTKSEMSSDTTSRQYQYLISSKNGDLLASSYGPNGGVVIGNPYGVNSFSSANPDINLPISSEAFLTNYPKIAFSTTNNNILYALEQANGFSGGTFYEIDASQRGGAFSTTPILSGTLGGGFAVNDTHFFVSSGTASSGDTTGTVYYAPLSNPSSISEFPTLPNSTYLAISPDGKKLYVGQPNPLGGLGFDGTVTILEVGTNTPVLTQVNQLQVPIFFDTTSSQQKMAVSFDGSQVYFISNSGVGFVESLGVIDAETQSFLGVVKGTISPIGYISNQIDYPYSIFASARGNTILYYTFDNPPIPLTTLITFPGQAGEMADYLNTLNANSDLPDSTAIIYENLLPLSYDEQKQALENLAPQFKVIQYAEEKLDLLLHKEIQTELYEKKDGAKGFVMGGYDKFKQNKKTGYQGYGVSNFYQMLGFSFDAAKIKWLLGIGASESYMQLNPIKSNASYITAWGTFGFCGKFKNFDFGVDGLYGYSFLNTHRHVDYLDQIAKSKHGLWSASADLKIGYRIDFKHQKTVDETQIEETYLTIIPYDTIGYFYGHENNYHEHGAVGDNFFVKDENLSIVRNQLGLKFEKKLNDHATGFIDPSWVYEYYLDSNKYKAALEGSNYYYTFTQIQPTRNYGRVQAGFEGTMDRYFWKLAYTGLYGKKLQDTAFSGKLGLKF
jgi:hypothetical protein